MIQVRRPEQMLRGRGEADHDRVSTMIRVRYLMLAKYAEFTPVGMLNLIGGDLDRIPAAVTPTLLPYLTAALRMDFDYETACKGMTVKYRVVHSDNREEILREDRFMVDPQRIPKEYEDRAFDIARIVTLDRIPIPKHGTYLFQILVDDLLLGQTFFTIERPEEIRKGWRSEFRDGEERHVKDPG